MDAFIEDNITPYLDRLLVQAPRAAAEAVRHKAAQIAQEFQDSLQILDHVQINDKIGSVEPQTRPVMVDPLPNGVQITIRPFYARAYDFRITQAVQAGGDVGKLSRKGLWVRKRVKKDSERGGNGLEYVDFEGSARLKTWAEDHNEVRRQAVLISGQVEISALWAPFRARLIIDVNRELQLRLGR